MLGGGCEFLSIKQGVYIMNILRFSDVNDFFYKNVSVLKYWCLHSSAVFCIINVDVGSFIVE